jgi:hypothetical protein
MSIDVNDITVLPFLPLMHAGHGHSACELVDMVRAVPASLASFDISISPFSRHHSLPSLCF